MSGELAVQEYREAVMDYDDEYLISEHYQTTGILAFFAATEPVWMPTSDGKRAALAMLQIESAEINRRGLGHQ